MRCIFWVSAAPVVEKFLRGNLALQRLSERHPLHVVYNGDMAELKSLYPKASFIETASPLWEKAVALHKKVLQDPEVDMVVRLDADAIVFDEEALMSHIGFAYRNKCLLSNPPRIGAYGTVVRGACLIGPAHLLRTLPWNPLEAEDTVKRLGLPKELVGSVHDEAFSAEIGRAALPLQYAELFEESLEHSGTTSVWHPLKGAKTTTWEQFERGVNHLD